MRARGPGCGAALACALSAPQVASRTPWQANGAGPNVTGVTLDRKFVLLRQFPLVTR